MTKEGFCVKCGKVSYALTKTQRIGSIHGVAFSYNEQETYCAKCGNEIYVPEVNDANVENQFIAYNNEKLKQETRNTIVGSDDNVGK